jgi:hypothetical protein
MAATHILPLPDRLAALPVMIIGAGLLAFEVILSGRLAEALTNPGSKVAVGVRWVVALYYPLTFWTLRGMEVGLEAVILTAAVLLAVRSGETEHGGKSLRIGLILAAGVLTRDDIVIPALVITAFVVLRSSQGGRTRAFLATATPWIVAVTAHTAFRALYYHSLLPNTYYLKVSGIPASVRLLRGSVALFQVTAVHLAALLVLAVVFFAGKRLRVPPAVWLLAGLVCSTAAYAIAVGGDAWEWMLYSDRYLVPVIPLLVVLAVIGIDVLLSGSENTEWVRVIALAGAAALADAFVLIGIQLIPGIYIQVSRAPMAAAIRRAAWVLPLAGVLTAIAVVSRLTGKRVIRVVLLLTVIAAANGSALAQWWHSNAASQHDDVAWARYGQALRGATSPSATIAVSSAGNIAYFDDRQSVDLLGKSDRLIAHLPPVYVNGYFLPGHSKRDLAYSVGRLRPDVVAELFGPSPADFRSLRSWGYVQAGSIWYLPETPGLNAPALASAVTLAH